jgi:N-acetyl-anhydromuramyl-L-alanine amidase AmpD/LAS superfamily LD-carboxypeptidase LdcB
MSETWFEDVDLAESPFATEVEAPAEAWPSESAGLPPSWPEGETDGVRGEQPFATEAWTPWAPAEAWSPEMEELTFGEAEEQAPGAGLSASRLEWPGAPAGGLAFMRAVYDKHVERSRAKGGTFVADLPDHQLGVIQGSHKARKDAAAAARTLLARARAALAASPSAAKERIGVISAYRPASRQFDIWQGKGRQGKGGFPYYYQQMLTQGRLHPGDYSPAAVAAMATNMAKWIAAPGYSNHQDGLAIDFGSRAVGGQKLRFIAKGGWFHSWLAANMAHHPFRPYPDEPWHWIYHGPGRELTVDHVPLLAIHRGRGPDLILGWNVSSVPEEIDVVVHLHGFWYAGMRLDDDIVPYSGLDLAPVGGAPGQGRSRPTLTVLPRGNDTERKQRIRQKDGSFKDGYNKFDFPELVTKKGFPDLVRFSLERFAAHLGGTAPRVGRLILTAHSGGGKALLDILKHQNQSQDLAHDPHQVHVFDALYQDPKELVTWARRHIDQDRKALAALAAQGATTPREYMTTRGGALRVFYLQDPKGSDTTRLQSRELYSKIAPKLDPGLKPWYRVELSSYGHFKIPMEYGWQVLADASANVPRASTEPVMQPTTQPEVGLESFDEWEAPEVLTGDLEHAHQDETFEPEADQMFEPSEASDQETYAPDEASPAQAFLGVETGGRGAGGHEFVDEDAALEWEDPESADERASLDVDTESFDSEIWTGSADQLAFRDRVLAAQIEQYRARRGSPLRDLSPDELKTLVKVRGTDVETFPDTAAAAFRLLRAANIDLLKAQQARDADALRTIRLSAESGYRSSRKQRELWLGYFRGYYDRSRAAREKIPEGPHSAQAVAYMLKPEKHGGFGLSGKIAAPGYSNHQNGIAIDFSQERHKDHTIKNSTVPKWRAKWRDTWFHRWLRKNAHLCGFKPIASEEWHWEYRKGATPAASAPGAVGHGSVSAPASEQVRFTRQELEEAEPSSRFESDVSAESAEPEFETLGAEEQWGTGEADEPEFERWSEGELEPEDLADDEAGEAEPEEGLAGATTAETTELMLTEAALSGELVLDPLTPAARFAAPAEWRDGPPPGEAAGTQLFDEHQVGPMPLAAVVTAVALSVRTDFTVRTATGTRFDWAHGEAVSGARAGIVGTAVSAVSDANGNLRLNTTGLRDGFYTIRIEHTRVDQTSPDIAGPTVADPLPAPPRRIYRPLNVWVGLRGGRITGAMVALFSPHGGIGNRSQATFDATHLPIDWKPVWMRSAMKATEGQRATPTIDLVVVHRPDRSDIGPAINTFLSAAEVGNAHYLIDHNGHVIKMAEDRRRANHTGFSRWRGNGRLNAASIGIEVMRAPDGFTPTAMAALIALIERLRAEYPSIPAHRIVGHSDIATSQTHPTLLSNRRLEDPGHQFDWALLERRGLGMVPGHVAQVAAGVTYAGIFDLGQPADVLRNGDHDRHGTTPARLGGGARADVTGAPIAEIQADLEHIGYSVRPAGGALGRFDTHTVAAVDRFQRHFFSGSRENLRPTLGRVDVVTALWIRAVRPAIP